MQCTSSAGPALALAVATAFGAFALTGCARNTSTQQAPAPTAAPTVRPASAPRPHVVSRYLPIVLATAPAEGHSAPGTAERKPGAAPPELEQRGAPAPHPPPLQPGRNAAQQVHGAPQIYGVSVSPSYAGGGDVVSGTIATSPNVTSVFASVGGISSGVPRVGAGLFAMSYRLPAKLPASAKGTYTIVVVARSVEGATTSRSVAITLH